MHNRCNTFGCLRSRRFLRLALVRTSIGWGEDYVVSYSQCPPGSCRLEAEERELEIARRPPGLSYQHTLSPVALLVSLVLFVAMIVLESYFLFFIPCSGGVFGVGWTCRTIGLEHWCMTAFGVVLDAAIALLTYAAIAEWERGY